MMPLPANSFPVCVKPFQERFLYLKSIGKANERELAELLGYFKVFRGRREPDGTRVLRDLGLAKKKSGTGHRHYTTEVIAQSKALRLCEVLHMDPVDADF